MNQIHIKRLVLGLSAFLLFAGIAFLTGVYLYQVTPPNLSGASQTLAVSTSTANATSTLASLTGGLATSTLVLDSGADGSSFLAGSVSLMIQYVASSTVTMNVDIQHSPNAIDWYDDPYPNRYDVLTASSSPSITNLSTISYTFSSTTQDRIVLTNLASATSTRIVKDISFPLRYIRAVFTMPTGTNARGMFWAQMTGKKDIR